MERKIGEVFEIKLKVVESEFRNCFGCYFKRANCEAMEDLVGECQGRDRMDNKNVIFVEAKEEENV